MCVCSSRFCPSSPLPTWPFNFRAHWLLIIFTTWNSNSIHIICHLGPSFIKRKKTTTFSFGDSPENCLNPEVYTTHFQFPFTAWPFQLLRVHRRREMAHRHWRSTRPHIYPHKKKQLLLCQYLKYNYFCAICMTTPLIQSLLCCCYISGSICSCC